MSDGNRTRIIRPSEAMKTQKPTHKIMDENTASEDDLPRTRLISNHGITSPEAPVDEEMGFELTAGWLVVVKGPGRGVSRQIYYGMNSVGRGPEERICIDFGDTAISREAHAYVTFDEKQSKFYLSHGGKSNIVRLNDAPVLSAEPLTHGDMIEIGSTLMMFVPFCGNDFSWEGHQD